VLSNDTDNDGITDGLEVLIYGTIPTWPDTDWDGLIDSDEVWEWGTDPLYWDTDADGYADGQEVDAQTNPLDPNSHP
jgi:hypothetical protein